MQLPPKPPIPDLRLDGAILVRYCQWLGNKWHPHTIVANDTTDAAKIMERHEVNTTIETVLRFCNFHLEQLARGFGSSDRKPALLKLRSELTKLQKSHPSNYALAVVFKTHLLSCFDQAMPGNSSRYILSARELQAGLQAYTKRHLVAAEFLAVNSTKSTL